MAYNKTEWVSKKTIITAEAMNNIEDGIDQVTKILNDIKLDAPEELDSFKEVADTLGYHANLTKAINEKVNTLGENFDELKQDANQRIKQRFYSEKGESVEIDNGANGYVVSGKFEGNTIISRAILNVDGSNPPRYANLPFNIELNKTYTIVFEQLEGISDYGFFCLNKGTTRLTTPYNSKIQVSNRQPNGVRFGVVTTNYVNEIPEAGEFCLEMGSMTSCGKISNKVIILEGDCTDKIDYYNFNETGICAVNALITNNDKTSFFYETELDQNNYNLIKLNKVEDVCDTLEILEDGSGILSKNINEYVITGDEEIHLYKDMNENMIAFRIKSKLEDLKIRETWDKPTTLNSHFENSKFYNIYTQYDKECVSVENNDNHKAFSILIKKTRLKDNTVESMREYIKDQNSKGTPIVIKYQSATPKVVTIPKELMPNIKTYSVNNISVGNGVRTNKYYIDVPVRVIYDNQGQIDELEKQIAELEYYRIMSEI